MAFVLPGVRLPLATPDGTVDSETVWAHRHSRPRLNARRRPAYSGQPVCGSAGVMLSAFR